MVKFLYWDRSLQRKTWKIVKSSKVEVLFVSMLFLSCVIYGYICPEGFDNLLKAAVEGNNYENMSMPKIMISLFLHNSKIDGIVILLGISVIFPIFVLVANGVVIGAAIERASENIGWWEIVGNLAPHGVFEIPAMILAFAVANRIAGAWFKKNRLHNIKERFKEAIVVYVFVILPLSFIAAMIEGALLWNAINCTD